MYNQKNLPNQRALNTPAYHPPVAGRRAGSGETRSDWLLDFNEWPVPEDLSVTDTQPNAYPEYGTTLLDGIATNIGVTPEQIVLANGSDRALDLVFRVFTTPEKPGEVILPTPSYAMYDVYTAQAGVKEVRVSFMQPGQEYSEEAIQDAVTKDTEMIVLCNPNSPTGSLLSKESIARIAGENPTVTILIDEAYSEFSGVSSVDQIAEFPNIIVTRTFSKAWGLASIRLGYTVSSQEAADVLRRNASPYDIPQLSYQIAAARIGQGGLVKARAEEVMNRSKPMVEDFFRENGVPFIEGSAANFVLIQPPKFKKVYEKLAQAGFRVRIQDKPGIEGSLRVTIGPVSLMEKFMETYRQVVL
ncbi:histidinol-phosphate aminotransferase family protein [Candidatus Saccharibacteria bacterium]|jgi:histidinol-phosphate aminotransferase|nr:histidinol-phosphate aminotransferase family protein [Candidatus Saccharibacteria bacterium]